MTFKLLNECNKANIKKIAKYSCQAKRIVLLFGQGALIEGQFVNYKKISELINAHVVTSLMGIGSYDTKDKRFLGYLGHTGHYSANIAVHEADLLIVLGSRLDLRQTGTEVNNFSPNAKIAWIDIDNTEIKNPRVKVNWSLNISVKEFCSQFLNELQIIKLQISKKDALWIKKILKIVPDCDQQLRFNYYKTLGVNFKKVLDIGAYLGTWRDMFQKIFPDAEILMIEANKEKEEVLRKKRCHCPDREDTEDKKLKLVEVAV